MLLLVATVAAEPHPASAAVNAAPQSKSGAKPSKQPDRRALAARGLNLYKRTAKLGIPAPGEITIARFVIDVSQPRTGRRGVRPAQAFRPAVAIPASEPPAGVTVVGGIWRAKKRTDRAIAVIVVLRATQTSVSDRSVDLRFWSQLPFRRVARTQVKNVLSDPRKASCLVGLDGRLSNVGTTQLRGPTVTLDSSRRWSLGLSGLRPRQILRTALFVGCGRHRDPFYGLMSAALRSNIPPPPPAGTGAPDPTPGPTGEPGDPSPNPGPGPPPDPSGNQSCTLAAAAFDSTQMVVEVADCSADIGKIVIDSLGISVASHIFPDGTCTTGVAIVCAVDEDIRETAILIEYANALPANARVTGKVDDFNFDIPLT